MAKLPVKVQNSAGGVAFRRDKNGGISVALIAVGPQHRWQLPKGLIDKGEAKIEAAVREVREEAGINTDPLQLIDSIEYWYVSKESGAPVRYHKFVHFFLLEYRSGDVRDHDNEVEEARWFELDKAIEALAFESEREIMRQAKDILLDLK